MGRAKEADGFFSDAKPSAGSRDCQRLHGVGADPLVSVAVSGHWS